MPFGRITLIGTCVVVAFGVPDHHEVAFKQFIAKYGKVYHSPEEQKLRAAIFEANYNFINKQNAGNHSYTLAVNEFADQSPQEFRTARFGLSLQPAGRLWTGIPHLGTDGYTGSTLPSDVDWSKKGAVVTPKNQQHCGSCWAFSAIGALEGAWQIATGKLVSLSEQQLVDCSTLNHGCGGGAMDLAFGYFKHHAICTESSYAYTSGNTQKAGTCEPSSCSEAVPKGSVVGFYDVPTNDMRALMEAVAQQPVSVGIEADQMAFQLYNQGILSKKCGNNLDHGVLLVGYGSENGVDYWKVKNSWGTSWGEDGYVRLERGLPDAGECGIKAQASYPRVASVPTPGPSPGPAPPSPGPAPAPPTPGCKDEEGFCKMSDIFDPERQCGILASVCKKTCGCCGEHAPSYCGDSVATESMVVV
jgi:hypothetical protein